MKVLDLFSGIGGFSLGLERAGMETVAFCEIEDYPQRVLKKHWPDVPIYDDVRTLTKERLDNDGIGPIDLICGGYPCQPFSNAGKRRGEEDDRHLWPEVNRLIQEYKPSFFIGENVAGHVSMGLDQVLSDLERAGYTWETFIIPACSVDGWHRRDRTWIIAYPESLRLQGSGPGPHIRETQKYEKRRGHGGISSSVTSDPFSNGFQASSGANGRVGREELFERIKIRKTASEPFVCRGPNGIPNRMDRLKALGNAVVPQIPEIIGRAIMRIEEESEQTASIDSYLCAPG